MYASRLHTIAGLTNASAAGGQFDDTVGCSVPPEEKCFFYLPSADEHFCKFYISGGGRRLDVRSSFYRWTMREEVCKSIAGN
jgi:hypothetical protein